MPDYHATSDPHFGHDRVRLPDYSNRPFSSVEEMDEALIENWNNAVKPDDIIYELGDFAFLKLQALKALLRRLNGHKHAILGNHDKVIRKNKAELLREGLFESIEDYGELKVAGELLILHHYAQRVWRGNHYQPGSIHLFGHSHSSLPPLGKSVDVGVDSVYVVPGVNANRAKLPAEYRPYHLDEILAFMKGREFVQTDGHKQREKVIEEEQ